MLLKTVLTVLLALVAMPASAYIGPGAGLSFLGSLATWLVGILIALFAILFYPIRILIRRLRGKKPQADDDTSPDTSQSPQ